MAWLATLTNKTGGSFGGQTILADTAPQTALLPLREYQREAIDAITVAEQARGVTRPVVALPTGTGKTVIFSHLLRQRGGRSLILANRDELLQQAAEKVRTVEPGADIGLVKAEADEHDAPIVLASVQTLSRPSRLRRLVSDFNTIVVDECHHAAAPTYRAILHQMRAFEPSGGPLVAGFSATPERADGVGLDSVFQEIVYRRDLQEMIRGGYLSDLRAVQIRLAADFSKLHVRAGDYVDAEVGELLSDAAAPKHATQAYLDHAPGRKALVFTPTVALAMEMVDAFEDAGVRAAWLSGETPRDERRAALDRLRGGDLDVIANCSLLTEGVDLPSLSCIVIARPTQSRTLYSQMIGRGTRPYPGKSDCLILDLVGVTTRQELVTASSLLGLPPTDLARKGVRRAALDIEEAEQQRAAEGKLVAQRVELFNSRPLHWIAAAPDRFVLTLSGGFIALEARGESWTVVEQDRDGTRILRAGLSLDYAQGVAEDRARQTSSIALLDPNASWRKDPVSEKQIQTLRKFKLPVPPGLTKGRAHELIGAAIATRSRRW